MHSGVEQSVLSVACPLKYPLGIISNHGHKDDYGRCQSKEIKMFEWELQEALIRMGRRLDSVGGVTIVRIHFLHL